MYDLQIAPVIKKYDEALNQADLNNKLFVQLSPENFTFCIFNTSQNKFLSLESLHFETGSKIKEVSSQLKHFHSQHNWLNQSYQSIKIIIENSKSLLVPGPIFDENEISVFSKYNFAISEGEKLLFHKLKNLDAHIIYPFAGVLLETVEDLFPNHLKYSFSGTFIETLLILHKNIAIQKCLFINLRGNFVDIAVLNGRKLLYFNTFGFQTKEDFIYYVIFVIEQLQLNPEEIELVLSGNIDKNSKIFNVIYKYIRKVSFQSRTDSFNYSYLFNEIPPHYFFNLINLELCEL